MLDDVESIYEKRTMSIPCRFERRDTLLPSLFELYMHRGRSVREERRHPLVLFLSLFTRPPKNNVNELFALLIIIYRIFRVAQYYYIRHMT